MTNTGQVLTDEEAARLIEEARILVRDTPSLHMLQFEYYMRLIKKLDEMADALESVHVELREIACPSCGGSVMLHNQTGAGSSNIPCRNELAVMSEAQVHVILVVVPKSLGD